VQIVFDLMSYKDARVFNQPVQAKHAPGYFDKIQEPKDLGTIFGNLKDGLYLTAHQVRRDVTLVWKNCLIYNGSDSELTIMANRLAKGFDKMFDEAVEVPQHIGMASFSQGPQWINKKVEVYWGGDHEWYSGVIVEYNAEHANEQGETTPYRIKYNEDDEDEWINMPNKDVAIIDSWDGMADEIEPWEGFSAPVRGGAAPGRTQRSRTTTKLFSPNIGAAGRARGKRARASVGDGLDDDDAMGDAGGGLDGDGRLDGDRVASDFVCDDGQPCGDVCRCRLLFWCRFRTRKGMALAPKGSKSSSAR